MTTAEKIAKKLGGPGKCSAVELSAAARGPGGTATFGGGANLGLSRWVFPDGSALVVTEGQAEVTWEIGYACCYGSVRNGHGKGCKAV